MRAARLRRESASPLRFVTLIVILVFLGFGGWYGWKIWEGSLFGKFDRFNLVVISDSLAVLSVNSTERTATFVRFPANLYISELAFGYGAYQVGSIYAVGQLDKRGGETAERTLSDYLGIPVDGFWRSGRQISGVKDLFWDPRNLMGGESNLNILDRIKLVWTVLTMRFDKIKNLDLATWAGPIVLADGSTALSLDKEVVDNRLQGQFSEASLREEGFRLEVANSTTVVGLGNRAARILANMGANVVNVATTAEPISSCELRTGEGSKKSRTVSRVARVFDCNIINEMSEGARADVEVRIGSNYATQVGR